MELIAVFSPLFAFLIAGLFGKAIGHRGCQIVTCAGVIAAALASVALFFDVAIHHHPYTSVLAPWVVSGEFKVSWALRVDTLSSVMMCVINIVSACVHVYSVGYMSHDEHRGRFMAYLSLFTFAMLMLVTSDNLLQLFFGWEGVGLASYLLIGFWNSKPSANAAAQKAFVVNRVGDFGLALGLMATFLVFGSVEFSSIFANVQEYAQTYTNFLGYQVHALTLICLLLFVGAVGKSAQLGLHTWLPDAMEGPTPVSALIHAATMVTAGVFLVARMSPLFEYAPDALKVVTVLGACTAFVAATIGMTQFDIKRVIAYSTMSQLGYMFFALGVSAYGAAMFHLVTHAFFKALLFLGAGSVIHAMDGEQDMRKMGGIWKKIPATYVLMWIGSLALAGIFPFAGYYSKDIILESDWASGSAVGHFAYWMGIAAAVMTAFYSWRLIIMTFHGEPRYEQGGHAGHDHHHDHAHHDDHAHGHGGHGPHVHESPPVMLVPLCVLALGAVFAGGMLNQYFVGAEEGPAVHGAAHGSAQGAEHAEAKAESQPAVKDEAASTQVAHDEAQAEDEEEPNRHTFWAEAISVMPEHDSIEGAHHVPLWVKYMPLVAGAFGIAMAYLAYMFRPGIPAMVKKMFAPLYVLFYNKWFFDEIYEAVFVRNALRLGRGFWRVGDQNTIDRLGPDGSARAVKAAAGLLSRFQSGYVYQYAFVMMIAVIGLISWFVFKAGYGME
jgi:NADH-quinone oxidoreductase subunit L